MAKRAVTKWPKQVKIAVVGKYFVTGGYNLVDSYVSVVEAIRHASWKLGVSPIFSWIDSEQIEKEGTDTLKGHDGIIVPQGWGSRGTEGKIMAVRYARENNIPYLGLCFGMQMAIIEFARNVLGFTGANSIEANPNTKYPVIHIMPNQKEYLAKKQYGGTIRLGSWPCILKKGSKLSIIYGKKSLINERHRHRYEFNNVFKEKFEKKGMVFSGTSPDGKLVEAIELKGHKFFIGTQFHPEYISRPLTPHPIFVSFLSSMI